MKSNSLLVLACLVSAPVFAQGLPDEINYGPYEARYRNLERETFQAQATLNQSRASLQEAQRFIREMTNHIRVLHGKISDNQNEISRLRREIPELERHIMNLRSEDSRVVQEIRLRQNEESNLVFRYQQAQRDLRPLEELLARKEARLRDLQIDLNQFQRAERESQQRLTRAQSEAERIDRAHLDARNQLRQMQEEQRTIDSRIGGLQSQISSAQSSLASLQSNLSSERAKLSALNNRVSEYESDLSRLRSSNAPAEQIAQVERKLNAARNTRDNTAQEVRNLEGQISRSESQIRTWSSQIEDLRRTQSSLPSRISQLESRMRQLENERGQAQSEINRYTQELQTARRNVELREQQVSQLRLEMRTDEQNVVRQRQFIENVARQLDVTRRDIASLTQRSRNLNAEIARTTETARSHEARIPRLDQEVRNSQAEIAEGERDLVSARNDERAFTAKVAQDEATLNTLTARRNAAESEMNQRLSLYQNYLSEAEKLGADQSSQGLVLGKKEGERLATLFSRQNGTSVGREMGILEAKHWGSIRGEIEGHDIGYHEGLSSSEDIGRATVEASTRAALDAELFAQTNFKPVFFEEFVQEEFKKPFAPALLQKNLKNISFTSFVALDGRETITPPSASEISRSESLKTQLDSVILQLEKEMKLTEAKVSRLSNPGVTFEVPTKIPFGTPDCSRVYKGLAVFKASCEGSYKGTFTNNYVNSAREMYTSSYESLFRMAYNDTNLSQRESSYPAELDLAMKIGKAEGLRIGKIEIYQSTFESVYRTAYKSELEKARVKARGDAQKELTSFLKVKPLLTVTETGLVAENFRGGEEVLLNGKVKNISTVPLNGPVIVRITSLQNAEKLTGEAVLNHAGPMMMTSLPQLKIKISPSAKAGDKVIVKGVVDLPGDLYKTSRQETFELSQVLSANPFHDLALDFNRTPEIKGPFRRYIHFLSAKISPKIEDIKEGYKLTLSPEGENAGLIELKETEFSTGPLGNGAQKEARFSYVFKDQAKGKAVTLLLAVSYNGKIIRKELVTINPK